MPRVSVFAVAMLVSYGCVSTRPDDAGDVLSPCRRICGNFATEITLERKDGRWQVSDVFLASHVTDASLEELSVLNSIKTIEFCGSQATSQGIRSLSALRGLRRIVAPWNATHQIVQALCTLPQVEELELEDCREIGQESLACLANLPKLRRLSLPRVRLNDRVLAYVRALKNMQELRLGGDGQFTDAGLAELKDLQNMQLLDLSGDKCMTNGGLAELSGMKNLRSLNLAGNTGVTGDGLAMLKGLQSLRCLNLLYTKIPGTGLASLQDLPHLEQLILGGYEVSDKTRFGPSDISMFRGLTSLDIADLPPEDAVRMRFPTGLQSMSMPPMLAARGDVLRELKNLRHVQVCLPADGVVDLHGLETLPRLTEIRFIGNHDAGMKAIASMGLVSLHGLTLDGCWKALTDEGAKKMGRMVQLESLEIKAAASLTDTGLADLRNLVNLRRLQLRYLFQATPAGFAFLRELKRLQVLDLAFTCPRDRLFRCDGVLREAEALSELEELSLVGAAVTDDGLKSLMGLKKLRRLDLTGTHGYTDHGLWALMQALPNLQTVKRSYRPE